MAPVFLSLPGSGPGSLLLVRAVVHAALFPRGPAGRAAHVSPRPQSPLLATVRPAFQHLLLWMRPRDRRHPANGVSVRPLQTWPWENSVVPESRGLPEFVVETWAVESEWALTGGCGYKSTKARPGQGGAFPHCSTWWDTGLIYQVVWLNTDSV